MVHVKTHPICQDCVCLQCCTVWLPQADASKLESQAKELSGPSDLVPNAEGSDLQKALAAVADATAAKKFTYNKFFAVGLFRCGPVGCAVGQVWEGYCHCIIGSSASPSPWELEVDF